MGLSDLVTQFKQVEADIEAGEFVKAGRDTIPIQETIYDLAEAVGFKAEPNHDEVKAEVMEIATRCQTKAAQIPQGKGMKAGAQPVGAWGDGTFLKIILDALVKILPEILNK